MSGESDGSRKRKQECDQACHQGVAHDPQKVTGGKEIFKPLKAHIFLLEETGEEIHSGLEIDESHVDSEHRAVTEDQGPDDARKDQQIQKLVLLPALLKTFLHGGAAVCRFLWNGCHV